jgi:hypothetical protein
MSYFDPTAGLRHLESVEADWNAQLVQEAVLRRPKGSHDVGGLRISEAHPFPEHNVRSATLVGVAGIAYVAGKETFDHERSENAIARKREELQDEDPIGEEPVGYFTGDGYEDRVDVEALALYADVGELVELGGGLAFVQSELSGRIGTTLEKSHSLLQSGRPSQGRYENLWQERLLEFNSVRYPFRSVIRSGAELYDLQSVDLSIGAPPVITVMPRGKLGPGRQITGQIDPDGDVLGRPVYVFRAATAPPGPRLDLNETYMERRRMLRAWNADGNFFFRRPLHSQRTQVSLQPLVPLMGVNALGERVTLVTDDLGYPVPRDFTVVTHHAIPSSVGPMETAIIVPIYHHDLNPRCQEWTLGGIRLVAGRESEILNGQRRLKSGLERHWAARRFGGRSELFEFWGGRIEDSRDGIYYPSNAENNRTDLSWRQFAQLNDGSWELQEKSFSAKDGLPIASQRLTDVKDAGQRLRTGSYGLYQNAVREFLEEFRTAGRLTEGDLDNDRIGAMLRSVVFSGFWEKNYYIFVDATFLTGLGEPDEEPEETLLRHFQPTSEKEEAAVFTYDDWFARSNLFSSRTTGAVALLAANFVGAEPDSVVCDALQINFPPRPEADPTYKDKYARKQARLLTPDLWEGDPNLLPLADDFDPDKGDREGPDTPLDLNF